jgi:hypothetical protein
MNTQIQNYHSPVTIGSTQVKNILRMTDRMEKGVHSGLRKEERKTMGTPDLKTERLTDRQGKVGTARIRQKKRYKFIGLGHAEWHL